MRTTLFLMITALLLLSACASDEMIAPTPPTNPSSENLAGKAFFTAGELQGNRNYAPPWDLFHDDALVLSTAPEAPEEGSVVRMLVDHQANNVRLTYDEGWVFNVDSETWHKFMLTGPASDYPGFISGSVEKQIGQYLESGENYVLAFFCTDTIPVGDGRGTFACGCSGPSIGDCNKWNVQRVTVSPPEIPWAPNDGDCEDEKGEDYLNSPADCMGGPSNPTDPGISCDDGVQNGDETGVDCGGSCASCDGGTTFTDECSIPPDAVFDGQTEQLLDFGSGQGYSMGTGGWVDLQDLGIMMHVFVHNREPVEGMGVTPTVELQANRMQMNAAAGYARRIGPTTARITYPDGSLQETVCEVTEEDVDSLHTWITENLDDWQDCSALQAVTPSSQYAYDGDGHAGLQIAYWTAENNLERPLRDDNPNLVNPEDVPLILENWEAYLAWGKNTVFPEYQAAYNNWAAKGTSDDPFVSDATPNVMDKYGYMAQQIKDAGGVPIIKDGAFIGKYVTPDGTRVFKLGGTCNYCLVSHHPDASDHAGGSAPYPMDIINAAGVLPNQNIGLVNWYFPQPDSSDMVRLQHEVEDRGLALLGSLFMTQYGPDAENLCGDIPIDSLIQKEEFFNVIDWRRCFVELDKSKENPASISIEGSGTTVVNGVSSDVAFRLPESGSVDFLFAKCSDDIWNEFQKRCPSSAMRDVYCEAERTA